MLIVVRLSGCIETQTDGNGGTITWASRFTGTWESNDEDAIYIFASSVTFYSDYTVTNLKITGGYYEVKDGKLVITTIEGFMLSYDFTFADNDTVLIVTSLGIDKTATYVKQ